MTATRLVLRSLRHYARESAAVVLGLALAVAVLAGSLFVGDSIDASLGALERLRLGRVDLVLSPAGRTFRAALAEPIARALGGPVAPVLEQPAVASRADDDRGVPGVRLMGVDARFFALSARGVATPPPAPGRVVIGRALAERMGARTGDEVVLRVDRVSPIPRDLPLAADEDPVPLRAVVERVAEDDEMGRFDLHERAEAPLDAYVALDWLGAELGASGRANRLLASVAPNARVDAADVARAEDALARSLTLDDLAARLRPLPDGAGLELRSDRIFLDGELARAASSLGGRGVLTWFVDELRRGDRVTPYSSIAALGPPAAGSPPDPRVVPLAAPRDDSRDPVALVGRLDRLAPGALVATDWLAEDLALSVGDAVDVAFDAFGPAHRLERRRATFRVAAIVPVRGAAADPGWMPDVPHLTDVANCRDWTPGIPIEGARIRPKDEAWFHERRGTPKAFITLADAERDFTPGPDGDFGDRTALRFDGVHDAAALAEAILARVDPARLQLAFAPARRAPASAIDFGPLFVGFSLLLVVAALLLAGLLFSFSVEQRATELGTLRALGFPPAMVLRLRAIEAALLGALGTALGVPLGALYTRAVLAALSSVWRDAAALPALAFAARPATVGVAFALGLVAAALGLAVPLRAQRRATAAALLAGAAPPARRSRSRAGRVAWASLALGATLLVAATRAAASGDRAAPSLFFGAGAIGLVGLVAACSFGLRSLGEVSVDRARRLARAGMAGLALRAAARRRGRSVACVALLAAGAFLVVSVSGYRQDPRAGAERRDSGTGGFALVATSTRAIGRDLDDASARAALGVEPALAGARVVSVRVHEGDEASCTSPGRATAPRVYGVDPAPLLARGAFTFTAQAGDASPWRTLSGPTADGAVPAIGDEGTVVWSLHLAVGDVLEARDGDGRPLPLRIVGVTAPSVLQGGLVIADKAFRAAFPGDDGYRLFLVDTPDPPRTAAALERALGDDGLVAQPAWRRLAVFEAVENTYLAIFQALGALGVLLGAAGVAVLLLRSALERRGELALLAALGFRARRVAALLLFEHLLLVALGLGAGALAALVALAPALATHARQAALRPGLIALGAIAATALGSALLAAAFATLRAPAAALREE